MPPTFGSLFAGIGGMDLGLERAGMVCRWQVEIDDHARKVLAKHWPDVARFRDVREVGSHNLEPVDVVAGGFPCQDVSNMGLREGISGARSGLWSEFFRIVCELRPRYVVVENVTGLLVRGIDRVLGDLASVGFDAEWEVLPACAFGAPHARERVFVVAYAAGRGRAGASDSHCRGGLEDDGRAGPLEAFMAGGRTFNPRRSGWDSEPAVARVAYGVPTRLVGWKNRRFGNAIVPTVAHWIGERIVQAHESQPAEAGTR